MDLPRKIGIGLIVVVGGIAAMFYLPSDPRRELAEVRPPTASAGFTKPADAVPVAIKVSELEPSVPILGKIAAVNVLQKKSRAQSNKSINGKPPSQDPIARAALRTVGDNPEAEKYWITAINDPNLPANERKDLIEDLNQEGLSNPKNPSPEDLSLILNRIELIEQLQPFAMDQVNADAFAEAYKDLVHLASGRAPQ